MSELKHFWDLLGILSNFGLGGIVFVIWYFSFKRQTSTESLVKNYQDLSEQHLKAFEQINERNTAAFHEVMESYRTLSQETRDAVLMNVRVNTKLAEKIESLQRMQERLSERQVRASP